MSSSPGGPSTATSTTSIALVGGRGYTGGELIRIISGHPSFSLRCATSRELTGQRITDHVEGVDTDLEFSDASPRDIARGDHDVILLALSNGASKPFVEAIEEHSKDSIVIDLSADHRFDDAWTYGLPEHFRERVRGAKRIANPGCYATAMQIAIRPVLKHLSGPATVFGVSGYSGAGSTPSDRNDPEKLRDNLMPYQLIGHVHEREASRHLGTAVHFHPHVAPFFRGITLTVSMPLKPGVERESLEACYRDAYASEPLICYVAETPLVRDIAHRPHCTVGGLTTDDPCTRCVVVATIDNLLKGAATQAIQNANLACGFEEFSGLL